MLSVEACSMGHRPLKYKRSWCVNVHVAPLHLSSSKAVGLGPDALGGMPVTMAPPDRLVELTFEADRVLVY